MTEQLLIFMVVNFFSALLSGAAGGGGGLISTPLMVILGLDPAQAIATAKFGGLGISLGASSRFLKEKYVPRQTIFIFTLIAVIAAIIGSLTLVKISSQTDLLENMMAIAILTFGIPLLYFRNAGLEPKQTALKTKIIGGILLFIAIVIQVLVGTGIGSIQLIILILFFGMTALVASATRRSVQLVVAIVSILILIATGLVNYKFGAAALITSFLGGFIGAHIAIKKGNKFVLNLFAVVAAIMAIQLLIS